MDIVDERKLIEEAKIDKNAFGKLYRHYFPQIFNYTVRRLADIGAAQEVTSDTFFEAMKDIKRFEWRGISFSAWLYRIATNNINSYFRKKSNKLLSLDFLFTNHDFEVADVTDIEKELIEAQRELERHKDFLLIHKQLLQLPMKYQEVITLRYFEKKKIQEISEILGKKENTVKSLLFRGIEKLQKCNKVSKGGVAISSSMQPFFIRSAIQAELVNEKNYEE
jgi:RNA polymerase sigma-70 factor, ECF subfamily